jgi:hypothetical protein
MAGQRYRGGGRAAAENGESPAFEGGGMILGSMRGSWQMGTASLALILFMVVAADARQAARHRAAVVPARAEPLAVYRPGEGAPSLRQWLVNEAPDDRQNLTIVAHYPGGESAGATRAALALADQARAQGLRARIVLEPSDTADIFAALAFDGRRDWHADCTKSAEQGAQRAARKDTSCD